MSLLMEALKKAEEAKRAANGNTTAEVMPELTLKPMTIEENRNSAETSRSPRLPELSLHIDSLDADLAAVSTETPSQRRTLQSAPAPASDSSQTGDAERTAARNVFAAKQAPRPRTAIWIFVGVAVVAALGLGGYFWWQLQSMSGGSLSRPPEVRQPPPTGEAPEPLAQAPTPVPTAVATETVKPMPESIPATVPLVAEKPVKTERPRQAQKTASSISARPLPTATPESPLRLTRSHAPKLQTIDRAYDALQAGRLDEAQQAYEHILRNDAKNTDVLLGLATIAARQNRVDDAQSFYLRALEADPSDPTAQAGVLNSRGQADPGMVESRLKTALNAQPDSSALHFALGNLYARQQRWSEAQQAYFHAYSTEPDNADFIFNLAVCLDQLHQNKLAAQYYEMALNAIKMHTPPRAVAFDSAQVKNRLQELQP